MAILEHNMQLPLRIKLATQNPSTLLSTLHELKKMAECGGDQSQVGHDDCTVIMSNL